MVKRKTRRTGSNVYNRLIKQGLTLTENGVVNSKTQEDPFLFFERHHDYDPKILKARMMFSFFKKRKRFNTQLGTSYAIKHDIYENLFGEHITNGELIFAALLTDLDIKRIDNGPNVYFNIESTLRGFEWNIDLLFNKHRGV